jgi:hypothetical protein
MYTTAVNIIIKTIKIGLHDHIIRNDPGRQVSAVSAPPPDRFMNVALCDTFTADLKSVEKQLGLIT